jgi:uncharacterized protein YvpB
MKQIIEVPHFVQFYNIDDDGWQGRSCGIASLAMILDFYGKKVDLNELVEKALKKGGYIEGTGWKHQAIVELAVDYGFKSFRTEDEKVENLVDSLNKNEPVIISIHKNFDPKNGGHLAVLCGYFATEDDGIEGFYVNDPIGPQYKHKYQLIGHDKFMEGWKRRAIYVKKQ